VHVLFQRPLASLYRARLDIPVAYPIFFSTYEMDTCSAVDRLDTSVESIDMNGEESRLGTLITTTPLCFGVRL
jgi:hypothetical protein